ncbi:MAG TPA: hypothetical protein VHM70_22600 [Polyangiaceae bacterium]|nr:hypothetical protein [Polyangiaceae bacterium]
MTQANGRRRALSLVTQARSNPALAQQVLQRLPEQLRLEFVEALSRPAPVAPTTRPGPRKCGPTAAQNGFSAQLNLFAKSVARVC